MRSFSAAALMLVLLAGCYDNSVHDDLLALTAARGEFTEVRTYVVRGYDEDDNVGTSNQAFVQLLLPPSGALLWEKTFDIGAHGAGRAATSGTIVDEPSIVVGFDKNTGARVGRYTPEGEAQMITAPSAAPTSSTLNGVAIDSGGQILAVGVDTVNGVKRPWLARVNPHTAAVEPLFTGKAGEVATGCAFDPKSGRIYVSGYSPDPKKMRPDARIWALSEAGELIWTKTWERPVQPNEKGDPIDVAFAVAVLENGDPILVGESQYDPPEPALPLEVWAFVRRYNPDGTLDPDNGWTSDDALDTAGARSVTSDRDNGLLVAGWSSVAEGAPQQATVFAFGALLKEAEIYMAEALDQPRVARGVARLQTGELVLALDANDGNMAEVRAVAGYFGPPEWIHGFQGETMTSEIGELSLTANGHILVVGTRSTPGANTMFLAALHP